MPEHKLSDALKMKGRSDERRLAEMSDKEKRKNALSDVDAPPLTEEELAEMKPVNDICEESEDEKD